MIHTHTADGMAVSAMECGLLPLTQMAMRFGSVAYHDFEGVVLRLDEQARLVANMGDNDLMILRNHGLLAVGASIPQAFDTIRRAEFACQAQVKAMSAGTPLVIPEPETVQATAEQYKPGVRRPFGVMEWPALLRKLDREDAGYRS